MEKTYISAQQLLIDSMQLGLQIYESGYRPNYIVGIWRGGAPVGIAVQEILDVLGVKTDHIAIRTSSYTGIGERNRKVVVHGLNYLVQHVSAHESLLFVDDVYDTGLSVQQAVRDLKDTCRLNTPEIKIATPYFKPGNNQTEMDPDFYIHKTDQWLVFPHELHGLSLEEIRHHKPELGPIKEQLLALMDKRDS